MMDIAFYPLNLAQRTLIASLILISVDSVADNSFLSEEKIVSNSAIMTSVRLIQKPKNVPAGVTVITSQRIRDLGLSRLPEVMRLIPGIRVTQASGWDYRINFHGTNGLIPRRMLVLVNGMAIHRYGFAEIDWSLVALDLEDIERIEVTRSPSSASYGSNAYQQVVNIITKHPQDVAPITFLAEKGNNGLYRNYGRVSGNIKATNFLFSLSKQGDNGFDYVEFDRDKPPTPGAVDDHDVNRAVFRSNTALGDSNLELNLGWIKSRVEDEEVDPNQLGPPNRSQEDKHIQTIFKTIIGENHTLKIQTYFKQDKFLETWNACNPTIAFVPELRDLSQVNSELAWQLVRGQAPNPTTEEEQGLVGTVVERFEELGAELSVPICGNGNQNHITNKRVLEVDDTFSIGNSIRFNIGLGYQNNDITSETYTNGTTSSTHKYAFTNMEYLASNQITINAGFMYENVSTVDKAAFAPRLGINYHLNRGNTIRLVYSTGKRIPNILETDRDWSYLVRDWDHEFDGSTEGEFFLRTLSPDRLKPESIESIELGIHGKTSLSRISYDARVFREELTDLISEKGEFFNYNITNDHSVDMSGLEVELNYQFNPALEFTLGYSYIHSEATNIFERTLYSRHQGFASVIYDGRIFRTALITYNQSPIAGESFDRTDLSLSKDLRIGKYNLGLQLTASYLGYDQIAYQWRTDNIARHNYDDQYLIKTRVEFSF